MNKHIKLALIFAAAALAGTGCTVDDYNDAYLDGFDSDQEVTDIQTVSYTLTDADYSSVANNAANKAIAEAAGPEAVEALAAVGTAKCFSEAAPAETYLPAFVSAGYNSYLSNGSTVTVTYHKATAQAEEIVKLTAAETYTVTGENYKSVWGETPANYFTPSKPLEGYADKFLSAAYPDAAEGTVKLVSYNYSDSEPSTGGESAATSIDESFAGGLNAWQIVKGESSSTWTLDSYNGVNSAKVSAFKTEGAQDLWLISEKVNLSASEQPQLAFDVKISYWTHDGLQVLVSTDYNGVTPEEATWTDLTHCFTFDGSTAGKWYTAGICDMSAYKSDAVYIAFRYTGNAAEEKTTTYQIGNIQLGDGVVTATGKELFSDAFEAVDAENNKIFDKWEVKAVADETKQWYLTTYSNNTYAQETANKAAGAVESWLVTKEPIAVPAFDAEGMTVLGFDLKIGYWNADCLTVLASENYTGDVSAAEWTDLTAHFLIPQTPTGGYADNFSAAGLAPLYQFAGKSVYIAFRYQGNGAEKRTTTYQVDNVKVASISRNAASAASTLAAMTRAAMVKERYAAYTFNGTNWEPTPDTAVINPEDYEAMGSSHPNFSSSFSPDVYLPVYLKLKYPYAQPEETKDIAYQYYEDNVTSPRADRYAFDGSQWTKVEAYETLEGPFKKVDGKWSFNPSLTIVVAPDKSELSKSIYQAGVDWVIANKDPMYRYDNRSDSYMTDSEYYSGCAVGYTNLNWRINTLPKYYWGPAGEDISAYENWASDDKEAARASYAAFYAETEKRFGEVMSGALGTLYPNVKMIDGIDVIYTLEFMLYTQHIGSSTGKVTHAFEFKLVADGQFEYVRMYALAPEFELMRDENFK